MKVTFDEVERFFEGRPAVDQMLVSWRPDSSSRLWLTTQRLTTTKPVPTWVVADYASTQGDRWGMHGYPGIRGEIIADEWEEAFGSDPATWPGVPFDAHLSWHRRGFESYEELLDTFIALEEQVAYLDKMSINNTKLKNRLLR